MGLLGALGKCRGGPQSQFVSLKFGPPKKRIRSQTWCQLDAQSDPKSPPKWTSGQHFPNFCANKATLLPIQYLQWFCYILEVLGRLFFDSFVEKTGVAHEPYKTTLLELDFSRILSKMTKIGTPNWGGAKPPQIHRKSIFDCRGFPWGSLRSPRPPKWSKRCQNDTQSPPK